jgi:hypothetical protein
MKRGASNQYLRALPKSPVHYLFKRVFVSVEIPAGLFPGAESSQRTLKFECKHCGHCVSPNKEKSTYKMVQHMKGAHKIDVDLLPPNASSPSLYEDELVGDGPMDRFVKAQVLSVR